MHCETETVLARVFSFRWKLASGQHGARTLFSQPARRPSPGIHILAVLLAGFSALAPASVSAQGARYQLQPVANWTNWDNALRVANGPFLGGTAGIAFGRHVGLTAYYLRSVGLETRLTTLPVTAGSGRPLANQSVGIVSYGGELSVGLATGPVVPLVMAGGGLLQFQPASGQVIRPVQLKYGLGLRTRLSGALEAVLMLERSRFFLDPLELAVPRSAGDPPNPVDPDAGNLRQNLALRAGLAVRFGGAGYYDSWDPGRTGSRPVGSTFRTPALTLEPFAGRQTFDADLGIRNQTIAGVRGGIGLGPFLGLHGFWWQGISNDVDAGDEVEGYGGELQLNFVGNAGDSPYLLVGGARMKFEAGAGEDVASVPADRGALILGAGFDVRLASRVHLSASARSYTTTTGTAYDAAPTLLLDVKDSGQLAFNWQASAGLKYVFGGDGLSRGRRYGATSPPDNAPVAAMPGQAVSPESSLRGDADEQARPPSASSPSVIVIPVGIPTYDFPGLSTDTAATKAAQGMTQDDLRDLLRAEIARALDPISAGIASNETGVSERDLDAAENRLAQLVRSGFEDIEREIRDLNLTEDAATPGVFIRVDTAAVTSGDDALAGEPGAEIAVSPRTGLDQSLRFPSRELRPYMAIQFTRGVQWIHGIAWDAARIETFASFNFVPEIAFGFGQGSPTWMAVANLQYRLPWVHTRDAFWINPVVTFGPGLLTQDRTILILNASYGVHMQLRRGRRDGAAPLNFYVAHQGVAFFRRDRLIIGLSLGI